MAKISTAIVVVDILGIITQKPGSPWLPGVGLIQAERKTVLMDYLVNRPLGARFSMTYARAGNTYAMPQSNWVLDSVTVFDGHKSDGVDSLLSTFVYEDGKYDRREREFFGFARVTTRTHNAGDDARPVYTQVTQNFANDNYYRKGFLLSEVMTNGEGDKYVEKINEYELRNLEGEEVLNVEAL